MLWNNHWDVFFSQTSFMLVSILCIQLEIYVDFICKENAPRNTKINNCLFAWCRLLREKSLQRWENNPFFRNTFYYFTEIVVALACHGLAPKLNQNNGWQMLNRFSCIALAGVATEYLLFGYAEGGLADIDKVWIEISQKQTCDFFLTLLEQPLIPQHMKQLDNLLKSLGFTQKKADSQVRWAVLNTILILRRHERARSKLAEAMSSGKSVGFCIDIIETSIVSSESSDI